MTTAEQLIESPRTPESRLINAKRVFEEKLFTCEPFWKLLRVQYQRSDDDLFIGFGCEPFFHESEAGDLAAGVVVYSDSTYESYRVQPFEQYTPGRDEDFIISPDLNATLDQVFVGTEYERKLLLGVWKQAWNDFVIGTRFIADYSATEAGTFEVYEPAPRLHSV